MTDKAIVSQWLLDSIRRYLEPESADTQGVNYDNPQGIHVDEAEDIPDFLGSIMTVVDHERTLARVEAINELEARINLLRAGLSPDDAYVYARAWLRGTEQVLKDMRNAR